MIDRKSAKHAKRKLREKTDKNKFKEVKNNRVKHKREKTPEQIQKSKKRKIIILVLIILFIFIFGICTAISVNKFKNLINDMATNQKSVIKDSDGNIIAEIGSEKSQKQILSAEIPDNLKNAYVAIEDQRFYKHSGVDIKRTTSAIASYVFHGGSSSYGGSSITQQLVKNLTGDSSSKISRKVKEWKNALIVESFMSKDEILELYLNIIYVGPSVYGVESGSEYYFSKSAKDLSLEECAFLAGINNSPNSYNPFIDNNNIEKINKRTKTVLNKMLEQKYITEDECNNAISKVDQGLNFKKGNIDSVNNVYSYHTDALLTQVIEDISNKKHISTTFATNYINMSGLTIYSTQNSKIQSEIEKEFKKSKYQLASKTGGEHSQAAMIIMDHKTGQVIGCVGGLGEKTTSRGFNRATQSVRQTGSAIKPLAVLVPGISKKTFTGATIFSDEKTEFADGYSPEDYSDYLGDITVRRALESSQNIPFVEMMQKITPKTSIKYLEKMGITTLTEKDNNLALSLGGLDQGISPLEMAGAYSTIANDGTYIEPTFYTRIINSNNKTIIEAKQKKKRVFSKEVAYIIKELLKEPVTGTNGTATYCSISGMDVAAKTGTTDENYDRWLCGFTPYYTGVTWYGFDQNETISYNGKKNPAGILWANIMSRIHTNLSNAGFEKPATVLKATICAETGKRANSGCSKTYEEYFLFGTTPDICQIHTENVRKENNSNKAQQNKTVNSFDMTTKEDLDDKSTYNKNNTVKEDTNVKNNTTNSNKNVNTQKQNIIVNNTTTENAVKNKENTNASSNSTNTSITNNTTKDSIVPNTKNLSP